MTVTLNFHKCLFTQLSKFHAASLYAITQDNELIYIGKSTVKSGVYNDVHHNRDQFGWSRRRITIWPGYIVNRRRSKSMIGDIEKLLVYHNQPRDNKHYKKRYNGRRNLTIICNGCRFLKKVITSSKSIHDMGLKPTISEHADNREIQGVHSLYDSIPFNQIKSHLERIPSLKPVKMKSLIRYSTGKTHVAWLYYPPSSSATVFQVMLKDGQYPSNLVRGLSNWGRGGYDNGYRLIYVRNVTDAALVVRLMKYVMKNI